MAIIVARAYEVISYKKSKYRIEGISQAMNANTYSPVIRYLLVGPVVGLVVYFASHYTINNFVRAAEVYEVPSAWPVSCFVYRDDNLNGRYDMPDRPYAGLYVEISRPDGSTANNTSNIAGFTNFRVGRGVPDEAQFFELGSYGVEAYPEDGWKITSDMEPNEELKTIADSNVGGKMILTPPCAHIGVGADLQVSGVVELTDDLGYRDISLELSSESGQTRTIIVNSSGQYSFSVSPGQLQLIATNKETGEQQSRSFEIKSKSMVLSKISFGDTLAQRTGQDITINFDDVTTSDTLYEIPSGYHGLDWSYWISTHNKFYEGAGYINGGTSGEFIAYNSSGFPGSFSSDEGFDFIGTNLTAAWPRGKQGPVVVRAWRGGELVHEDHVSISPAGPVYFMADYRSVEKVEFLLENYERIVMDDVSIRK